MAQAIDHIEVRYRRADTVGAWTTCPPLPAGQQSLQIQGIERGLSYQVEARAVGTNGAASVWVQQTHTVADASQFPNAPTSLTALSVADGVHLSWTIPGIQRADVEYNIQRTNDISGAPNMAGWVDLVNAKTTAFTDGVTDGVVRWYRVRAVDFLGLQSAFSNDVNSNNKSVADGADVTADQYIVYTGLSANLVPNGNFIRGNIDGWVGLASFLSGGICLNGGSAFCYSPSFNVIPGQKYRFSFTGYQLTAGTQNVYLVVTYGSSYAANIFFPPGTNVNLGVSIALTSTPTTHTYDWTCPPNVFYASLQMLEFGTEKVVFTNVSAQDYGAAGQWGADVTSQNIPTELLVNGSFEQGISGWAVGSGAATVDTSISKYGTTSLKLLNSNTQQNVNLLAGHTYLAQAWVKTDGSVVGTGDQGAGLWIPDPSNHIVVQKINGTAATVSLSPGVLLHAASATDWTLVQMTFTVSTSGTFSIVITDDYGGSSTGSHAWFDGVSLEDVSGGADVTSANTAKNTNNVGSLTVSGGLNGANGTAVDGSGNIVLKNIGTVQGTNGTLTSTFANLPSLGGMTYSMKGNPALVSVSLSFQATSSGGVVTNIGFSPSIATSTGSGPPNVSITITGDGSGATASVSWVGSGGPTVTFTPTVILNGGAGYSYAHAIVTVTVPSGTTYSGSGSGTYGCTVSTPTPQPGVSLSAQVVMDGMVLFDPTQGVTDANGRAKYHDLQVFSIPAGTHTFSVQAKYDGSTSAKFITGLFNVVELG